MGAQNKLFHRLFWLIDTVYSAKRIKIGEIDKLRKICILLFTLISTVVMAQTRFYKGNSSYSSDILYTWDGKSLYKGNSSYSSDIILTISGNRIYRGRSSYSSDILYNMDGPIPIPILMIIL